MKKQTISFLSMIIGIISGFTIAEKKCEKRILNELRVSNKNMMSFRVMSQWVKVKQNGRNLSEYFEHAGYKKIAIYGMGYMGETLLNELEGTKTEVLYGIDQNADIMYANVNIVSLEDELQAVDAIVVAVADSFEAISKNIQKRIDCPVVSIVDVVYDT